MEGSFVEYSARKLISHDLLVAEVPQALEHEKPHQSPDRQVGSPVGAVEREELFFKHAPVNRPIQTEKGVARIELAFQIGEQKGDFGLCRECLVAWSRIARFLWIWAVCLQSNTLRNMPITLTINGMSLY
jgi:hypothetical protein